MFNIPIVLFIFKRMKAIEIIKRIAFVKPAKLYIIADGGRTEEEIAECKKCRDAVEAAVDWDCEIIKNYADENRGVWENIGLGARWVFEREEKAIFLEDDNLPSFSFFEYCSELLDKYNENEKILWICGTNYLGDTNYDNSSSYYFTRHMLPCGWASWSHKFLKYYDPYIENCLDENICKAIEKNSTDKTLFRQFKGFWRSERERIEHGLKPLSWDYQMDFAIKSNDLYGIAPSVNLIKNIGVDADSIHGGNSFSNVMTKRFCSTDNYELPIPLKHPEKIAVCDDFERKIGKLLTYPLWLRLKYNTILKLRKILKVPYGSSIHAMLRKVVRK